MVGACGTMGDKAALEALLEQIYRERGFDFRQYRESTLRRRLQRRLRARRVAGYCAYGELLNRDFAEYDRLFRDLTINVSRFFRDETAFRALKERVLQKLMHIEKDEPIRIWSAGCAGGEEPFSIAMLAAEAMGRKIPRRSIRILGTDIDPDSVKRAAAGGFHEKCMEHVPSEYLQRYFIREGEIYRAKRILRESLLFQVHDLAQAAPFSGQDLVVCRNVLIYFNKQLQIRVMGRLHEALNPGGFLLLGKAEVPSRDAVELFDCVDAKAKLYIRK